MSKLEWYTIKIQFKKKKEKAIYTCKCGKDKMIDLVISS